MFCANVCSTYVYSSMMAYTVHTKSKNLPASDKNVGAFFLTAALYVILT